mgnify:CR=1 FL=1
MSTLAFYIDAPLQAWGLSSKFQHRETNAFPTKSAVVGLIAAAMGIDKHGPDEAERLRPLAKLSSTIVKLPKRGTPVTRLSDFHTVGGGFDKSASLPEKLSIPRKASGAPFGTVITHRSYLNDAAFAVLLEGEIEFLKKVQDALENPVWGVWFGRKACLPASPLSPTLGKDREAALAALLERIPGHDPWPLANHEYQEESTDGIFHQSDQPIAFGRHHGAVPAPYRSRGVNHHRPSKE